MYVSPSTYLETLFLLLGDSSNRSRSLVKDFLTMIDKHQGKRDFPTGQDDLIDAYRTLIQTVLTEKISQENQAASKLLLLKIKGNEVFKTYPVERDLLTDVLTAAEPITAEQIDQYLKRLRNTLLLAEIDETSRKIFAKSKNVSDIQDVHQQENEILKIKNMLEDSKKALEQMESVSDNKASETYVSLSDPESIKRALNIFMDRNVKGLIKTGLHGLNRALGTRGGFALGETAVFAASSHNYKSGMLVSCMIWTILYNVFVIEPGKRALIYFVSLENEVNQNLMDVFKILYCRTERRKADLATLSVDFITDWLVTFFKKYDVDFFIDRYSPHEFSYNKYIKRYNSFMEMGYQMVLFDLDYMSEARGIDPGDTFSLQGQIQLIKENYLKFMNHAKSQGYLLTTAHQLTKRAEELAAGARYAVKKFNPSLMADSSDVHRIIDVLIFLQLETNIDNIKFLTLKLHKNRGCKDTPEAHKFCAYPFTEFGIEDDVEGEPCYVTDIDVINTGVTDAQLDEAAIF